MHRLSIWIALLVLFFAPNSYAQLIKYSPAGEKISVKSDQLFIYIDHNSDKSTMSGIAPLSLPNIVNSFLGSSLNIVKSLLTKEQEKFSATYSATKTEKGLIYLSKPNNPSSAMLDISSISIDRMTDSRDSALHILLVPQCEPRSGLFRFTLIELYEPFTKAKIRHAGKTGKTVDLSIDVKLDAIWKEASNKSEGQPESYELKSSTLGQSTILVPNVTPGTRCHFRKEDGRYLSGWYQTLPYGSIKYADSSSGWKTGWYTITVTIKEANPYAYTSKQLSDFLASNGVDIATFLKQFFPSNGK